MNEGVSREKIIKPVVLQNNKVSVKETLKDVLNNYELAANQVARLIIPLNDQHN